MEGGKNGAEAGDRSPADKCPAGAGSSGGAEWCRHLGPGRGRGKMGAVCI